MKTKEKDRGMLTTATFVVSLLVIPAIFLVSATAAATTVEINDASAGPGATTTTTVTAYDIENLGNFGITLTFDPDVVNVTNITGGAGVGAFSWERIADNQVRFYTVNVLPIPSLSGNILLATLTLHAVGDLGDTSPLNLEIGKLTDHDNNPIAATPVNGTFTITEIDTTPPTIEFIAPTPADGSEVTVNYVNITVNVTDDKSDVSTVLLNWNGVNETMNMTADNTWSVNKTDLSNGDYTFKVYANDTAGNMGVSETRVVTVNVTGLPKTGDMNGDGDVNMDDVILLAKHYFFGDPVSDDPDVNSDGDVNMDDVILLAKHYFFGDPIYP